MFKWVLMLALLLFMLYLGIIMLKWMLDIITSPFRKLFRRSKYDDFDDDFDDFDF